MSLDFVNIHGARVIPTAGTRKPARPKKDAPAEFHKGFRVEGHPPGALESAREAAIKECEEWGRLTEKERNRRTSEGMRSPKPWDEDTWRARTKLKPVRSKPYELAQAADVCADMARKAGWLDVRVIELKKENA